MSEPVATGRYNHLERGAENRDAIMRRFRQAVRDSRWPPNFSELEEVLPLNKTTIYAHLRALVRAGKLVHRRAKHRGYELPPDIQRELIQRTFADWWEATGQMMARDAVRPIAFAAWMASRGIK
jgi:hypothetical protein